MSNQNLVSIIISCYNLGQYVDEAVDSILTQSYQNFEIIIVNDGSTDKFTNNLLLNYHKPKTQVFITKNNGPAAARNFGIKKSQGKYICCLDADDKYASSFLHEAAFIFDNDKKHQVGIVSSDIQRFGESFETISVPEYDPYLLANLNPLQSGSMFRKECWIKVKGYTENNHFFGYEDWDFWLKIVSKGYKWQIISKPLIYYRDRNNSVIKNAVKNYKKSYLAIINNNLDFFSKNHLQILLKSNEFHTKEKQILKDNYEKMLNNVYSSNFFKLWQSYNKILKQLKIKNETI